LSEKQTACDRSYAADHVLQSLVADLERADHKPLRRNRRTVSQLVCLFVEKISVSDWFRANKCHENVGRNANIRRPTIHDEIERQLAIDCDQIGATPFAPVSQLTVGRASAVAGVSAGSGASTVGAGVE
jgi:hypothetical protein